jgi:hypothetical protein
MESGLNLGRAPDHRLLRRHCFSGVREWSAVAFTGGFQRPFTITCFPTTAGGARLQGLREFNVQVLVRISSDVV